MNKMKTLSHVSLIVLLSFSVWSCASPPIEENPSEYPRQGSRSSSFVEGPHLVYENEDVLILQSLENEGQMALSIKRVKQESISKLSVHKSGFLPRVFDVQLKEEINQEASEFPEAEKLFAVSDIEGNFNTLVNLMQQHGIIDDNLNWSFGSGQFVMIGDVFDRGNHVTEMLWLLYGLEEQAKQNGGYVHILLGNHEAMNLRGDLRYVEPKYAKFSELAMDQLGMDHTDLYSHRTELGRWLRSKNVIEKIGDKIFVHAGISPALVESGHSLEKINDMIWKTLDTPKPDFTETDKLILGKEGPFWYRGYFDVNVETWGPHATQEEVDISLDHFDANQIIVGHTHVEKPELKYNGKVCAIDVVPPADHLVYVPPVKAYGVLIRGADMFLADENGQLVLLNKEAL